MNSYEKGYNDAVAEIATFAFAIWCFGQIHKGRMFKGWSGTLQLLGWAASILMFGLVFVYVVIPALRFISQLFTGSG
jgi:hypothetical protein